MKLTKIITIRPYLQANLYSAFFHTFFVLSHISFIHSFFLSFFLSFLFLSIFPQFNSIHSFFSTCLTLSGLCSSNYSLSDLRSWSRLSLLPVLSWKATDQAACHSPQMWRIGSSPTFWRNPSLIWKKAISTMLFLIGIASSRFSNVSSGVLCVLEVRSL